MKWLSDSVDFFKKERVYSLLFLAFVGMIAFSQFAPVEKPKGKTESSALRKFEKAEESLRKKIEKAGSVEKYFKTHPEYASQFHLVLFLAASCFTAGLILDSFFFPSAKFRKKFDVPREAPKARWPVSVIIKVVLQFTVISTMSSGVIAFLVKQAILPRSGQNLYLLLHTAFIDLAGFLLIYRVTRQCGGGLRDLGLTLPSGRPLKEIWVSLGGYLALIPIFGLLMFSLMAISELFHHSPEPHALVDVFLEGEKSPLITCLSIFLAVGIGPVFEEIFFRGFCYNVLKARFGTWVGMVISSAFFAAIHGSAFAFLPIFALGMGLAYLYEKRGTLLAPMTLHLVHNAIFIGYFFLMKEIVNREGGL